jgi:hypothetical protein
MEQGKTQRNFAPFDLNFKKRWVDLYNPLVLPFGIYLHEEQEKGM